MVDAINSEDVSRVCEQGFFSESIDQNLINQLIFFLLGCRTGDPRDESPQERALIQEITQLESSLSKKQADELKNALENLPTDRTSKMYSSELTIAFGKIAALVASDIPGGLSPAGKSAVGMILGEAPNNPSDKDFIAKVALWATQLSGAIASGIPGVLSDGASKELNILLGGRPNPGDKNYILKVMQYEALIEVFLAETLPSSLSTIEKVELFNLFTNLANIDLDSKVAPEEVQVALARIQMALTDLFFKS